MVVQAVKYFRKHSTAKQVPRKQRSRITTGREAALISASRKKIHINQQIKFGKQSLTKMEQNYL